jgi:hypothetical protein
MARQKLSGRTIVAALLAERREIAAAFRARNATEAGRAVPFETLGLPRNAAFQELVKLGVVQQVGSSYWLDDVKFNHTIEQPRFRVFGVVTVSVIFLVLVVAFIGVLTAGR